MMTGRILPLLLALMVLPPVTRADTPPWAKPGWTLTFHDEFSGSALDSNLWITSYPHGGRTHGADELEYYAPDADTVSGGELHLQATQTPRGGRPYTSGMIASYGHFAQTYGWFEIRARMPAGKGYWPAFWLLPAAGAWPPEIDVLEVLGDKPQTVYMTDHWAEGTPQQHGTSWTGPDFSAGFHTFAVDWEPGRIRWYVDGVERGHSTEGVPAEPMYVLANLAVGGAWPGDPDATTVFPGTMDIDYIRVYKRVHGEFPPFQWGGKRRGSSGHLLADTPGSPARRTRG